MEFRSNERMGLDGSGEASALAKLCNFSIIVLFCLKRLAIYKDLVEVCGSLLIARAGSFVRSFALVYLLE